MTFTPVTVTRVYQYDNLTPASGEVRFTPTAPMINAGETVVVAARTVQLDAAGEISIVLAANDDPDTVPPSPWASYLVEERITGQDLRQYYVQIPAAAIGGTVDLGTLNTLQDPPVVTYPAPGPIGPQGLTGPAGADGADGVSVTAAVVDEATGHLMITLSTGATVDAGLARGADGTDGTDGTNGVGVPTGGTAGEVLAKASGADYATEWAPADAGPVAGALLRRDAEGKASVVGVLLSNGAYIDGAEAVATYLGFSSDVGPTFELYRSDHPDRAGEFAVVFGGTTDAGAVTFVESDAAGTWPLRFLIDHQGPSAAGNRMRELAEPTAATDATTKGYVDGALADSARLPRALSAVAALGNVTGTVATDASSGGNFRDGTMTGNVTLAEPTNPTEAQILHFRLLASGATRTVSLAAALVNASGAAFPLSVPAGKLARLSVERMGLLGKWVVTAAEVTP